ncbi:Lysine-specific demethylase 8 [Picochlorum sp. SENEW3]|nr:Lysine-specific demethylase 8 [Picochlorum sp. SENEW3]WPT18431.1 Lysine-specific demethylase 8 [Picochlorum sp. SENEW3]
MREEEFLDSLVQHGTLNNKQKQSSSFSTEAYTQCGTPKLFSGALLRDAWPACRTWTSANAYQRLKDLVPNNETMVEVMQSSPSSTDSTISIFKGSGSSLQTIHMTFKDFIESSDVGLYLAQAPIVVFTNATAHKGILYGLSEDVKIPSMLPPGCDMVSVNAWCSGPGSVLSSLHYDCHENLLCVVDGEKIVRLAPFDVVPTSCLFYEHPYEWGYGNHTDSYTLFPEYTGGAAKQRAIDGECVETHHLIAGDVLYIPKGYWHQVLSGNDETHTIAINFWWDTPSENNPLFARLLKENEHIAAHGWECLVKRAERSAHDILQILSRESISLKMIQQSRGTDMEALVLANVTRTDIFSRTTQPLYKMEASMEAMVAYAFSRGFDVFHAYLLHISTHEDLTRWMWQHATPTTVEYLTSGLTHLAGDTDPSDVYRAMYSHIDTLEEFQKTLESRKMEFKSSLVVGTDAVIC